MKNVNITNDVKNIFDLESTTDDTEETPVKGDIPEQLVSCTGEEKEFNWENIPVPEGYVVKNNGVFKKKYSSNGTKEFNLICCTPIAITSIGKDTDNDDFWYEITFKDSFGQIVKERATQQDLTRKSKVWKFCDKGVNITDKTVGSLCDYFSVSINKCPDLLPKITFVQSNGWKDGQQSFVLGNRMYTKSGITEVVQLNSEETKGIARKGSLENWTKGVKGIICDPIVRFKCYCAATSVLLKPLSVQSFIVDHAGDTSTGKTFSVRVAVSMYGDPYGLKYAGNSTNNYLEDIASKFTDLPLFVDETSTQNDESLVQSIYIIANEVGKGRAKKDGGVQKVNRWKSVTFTTGEKPIIDYGGFGGQQVRVVEICRTMPNMHDQIIEADEAITDNYGHIFEQFITKIIENKDKLQSKYKIYRRTFTESQSRTENRMGHIFAAIALAGEILEGIFADIGLETMDSLELTMDFFKETVKSKPVESPEYKALRFIDGWFEENKNNFVNPQDPGRKPFKRCGYMQDHYIDIIPTVLNDALRSHKFNPSAVKDKWIEFGILLNNKGRKDCKVTYKDENGETFRTTVCRIDSNKMQDILENGM